MNMEWKEIDGYEGNYFISNTGLIKNSKDLILRPSTIPKGYLTYPFSLRDKRKNYLIHRLVAIHFIENPDNLPQVNHKDGNKLNNNVDNLEWTTNSNNLLHAYATGLKSSKGDKSGRRKISQEDVDKIRELKSTISLKELAIRYNISYSHIRKIACGTKW